MWFSSISAIKGYRPSIASFVSRSHAGKPAAKPSSKSPPTQPRYAAPNIVAGKSILSRRNPSAVSASGEKVCRDRLRAPILTARRRLLRQLIRRSSAGLCLRHVTGGVVYGFLRFGLPLLRACAERQQQNQCQQQGDRLLAGNSHSRSLPLIPLRRESNLPFLRAAMLFRPRSAGQVICGAPPPRPQAARARRLRRRHIAANVRFIFRPRFS